MISDHIQDPNCIILMVSPANADLGNSETVRISRDFDKEKQRTLCVITKADLATEGFAD